MSSNVTTHHGGAVGAAGHFDVRAMMRHYLAPFKAAEPWRDMIETIGRSGFATQRCDGELIALSPVWNTPEKKRLAIKDALAIRQAVAGHLDAVWEAAEALDEAMEPPPEEIIRAILGAMLSVLRGKPNEGAELYIDALVWALTEPDSGEPFCAPAIAAAAKEIWTTKTFPPSVPEFMAPAKKHQMRIEAVWEELDFISVAYRSAREVLATLAPEKLPKPRELTPEEEEELWDDED
jgi:hypothetical protein